MKPQSVLVQAVILLVICAGVPTLRAQDSPTDPELKSRNALTVGPVVATGASISIDPPEGLKLKPLFAYEFGVHITAPIISTISGCLQIAYESRGTRTYWYSNDAFLNDYRVNYLTLYPHFTLSGVSIGVNFGFPLNGDASEVLPVMIEPRLGGIIPLYNGKEGWLGLKIDGGYSLSQLIEYPDISDIYGDWHHASAKIGVLYEFAIPGTEREL